MRIYAGTGRELSYPQLALAVGLVFVVWAWFEPPAILGCLVCVAGWHLLRHRDSRPRHRGQASRHESAKRL